MGREGVGRGPFGPPTDFHRPPRADSASAYTFICLGKFSIPPERRILYSATGSATSSAITVCSFHFISFISVQASTGSKRAFSSTKKTRKTNCAPAENNQ